VSVDDWFPMTVFRLGLPLIAGVNGLELSGVATPSTRTRRMRQRDDG